MNTVDNPPRSSSRWIVLYLGSVTFLTAIGNVGLISIMPAIGRLLTIPDYLVASIFSLSALTWAVSAPFWVAPVKRRGPNYYIRAGMVGFVLSMAGCALSVKLGMVGPLTPVATFFLFFVLRSIYGLLGSAGATATQSLVAMRTDGDERTKTLTALAGALSLGTIVGPAIAPWMMIEPVGPLGPMIGFAGFGLVALFGSYYFLPRHVARKPAQAPAIAPVKSSTLFQAWRHPVVGPLLTFGFVVSSAQAVNIYTIGFAIIDRSGAGLLVAQRLVGVTMAAGAIAALAAQWGLVRYFSPSPKVMMRAGVIFACVGNAAPALVLDHAAAFWGFVISSFGYGLARPGFSAAASLAGSDDDQVAIASAVTLIAGASITLPPLLATVAYQWWPPAPFAIAAIVTGTLTIWAARARKEQVIVSDER